MTSAKIYGRSFVILNASTLTFVYCQEEGLWHEWNSSQGTLWNKCAGVSTGSSQVTYSISNTLTGGKVYVINPTNYVFQDDSQPYTALAQSALIGDGSVRTFWQDLHILADQEQTTSELQIYASDDDYDSASLIGTVDLSLDRPRLHRCGSAYRRSWIFNHSSNTPFRIEAMMGTLEEGNH